LIHRLPHRRGQPLRGSDIGDAAAHHLRHDTLGQIAGPHVPFQHRDRNRLSRPRLRDGSSRRCANSVLDHRPVGDGNGFEIQRRASVLVRGIERGDDRLQRGLMLFPEFRRQSALELAKKLRAGDGA
jgi:hypothetical protein